MFSKFNMKKIGLLPLLLALTLFAMPASALDLGQARAQGLVKETASGYLVAAQPSAEVKALVNKINAGRKAEYQRIAKKNGTPLSVVEQQAGKKLTR